MQIGVIIDKGPADWQIIQQQNLTGRFELAGHYVNTDKTAPYRVWVRVVREASSEPVIMWSPVETHGDGTWAAHVENVPAGGLYRIETCLKEDAALSFDESLRGDLRHHIGVGDVFVIAGQSNAAGFARDYITDEPQLGVHLLKTSGKWDLATHPLNDSTDTMHEANREPMMSGHSPFLSFGKYMKRELGYPIGLVAAALGGSPLKEWMPTAEGVLLQNMMAILAGIGNRVAGILWYQGCSDAHGGTYGDYLERFSAFVEGVRDRLNYTVPFYTVQLNRRVDPATQDWNAGYAAVREAQRQAAKRLEKVYMVPALDGSLSDVIHNNAAFNMVLGERIAKLALAKEYGRPFFCDAPDFGSAKLNDKTLTLTLTHVTDRLEAFASLPQNLPLHVTDDQGKVEIVQYQLLRNSMVLELERIPHGPCFISNAPGSDPTGRPVIDFGTHYPLVAFSNEPVEGC